MDEEGNIKIKNRLSRPLGHKRGPSVFEDDNQEEDSEVDYTGLSFLEIEKVKAAAALRDCCNPIRKDDVEINKQLERRKKVHETAKLLVRAW